MQPANKRIKYLLEAYSGQTSTEVEEKELFAWIDNTGDTTPLQEFLARLAENEQLPEGYDEVDSRAMLARIRDLAGIEQQSAPVHRIHFLKTAWFKYAAAIILIATGVAIYYIINAPQPKTQVMQNTPPAVPVQDVLPGTDRAVLTLSDGSKVELNNAASETIKDGILSIRNSNGQLSYSGLSSAGGGGREARTAAYNTMSTPKGGQYKLTLSDGTKVWLNAASSITYPIAFTGKTREVSVTGEAYFEVSKNKEKPFIVSVTNGEGSLHSPFEKGGSSDLQGNADRRGISPHTATYKIEVLGTSFNVNSYPDETGKTSLIEGSVLISSAGGGGREAAGGGSREARTTTGIILKPNQAYQNGKVTSTNTAQDIAWLKGYFDFNGADLPAVMRQLARWYNIDVKYSGKIPGKKFVGELSRDLNLSQVLATLSDMNIKYSIEGTTLTIK